MREVSQTLKHSIVDITYYVHILTYYVYSICDELSSELMVDQ